MVVTKRAPARPAPASRVGLAQQVPRPEGRPPMPTNISELSSSLSKGLAREKTNGPSDPSPKKGSKPKSKSEEKKGVKKAIRKRRGLNNLLLQIFLLWFIVYTALVCPEDDNSRRPICRTLSEYRRLVVKPYILSPIHMALSHPSIAPYVEHARPYVDTAIRTSKPVAQGAVRQWNARVLPQWNKYVAPQWQRHIVPLWYRYAVPQLLQLDAKVAPYRNRATDQYERHVSPYVRQAGPYVERAAVNARKLRAKIRPYAVATAHKTYDGCQRVAPYARPAWEKLKTVIAQLVAFLAKQRRQFVDPHVQKIWERVKELSSGTAKVPAPADVRESVSSRVSRAAEGAASVASSLMSSPTPGSEAPDATATTAIPDALTDAVSLPSTVDSASLLSFSQVAGDIAASVTTVAIGIASDLQDTALSATAAVSDPGARVSSQYSSISNPAVRTASSLDSEYASDALASKATESVKSVVSPASDVLASSMHSLPEASPTLSPSTQHAALRVSSIIQQVSSHVAVIGTDVSQALSGSSDVAPSTSIADSAGSSAVVDAASPVESSVSQDSGVPDVDLDAFYAELGLNDIFAEVSSSTTEQVLPPPPAHTETEQEKEERLRIEREKTAEKRVEIESRHTKWEDEQVKLMEDGKRSLRRALVALRKAAAAELKESAEIRAEIDGLVEKAEDLLKGAEKYLQTLVKEHRSDDEKRQLLERVLDKVNEKFTDRLSETEAVLNGWYAPWLDKELAEVRKVKGAVKDHAETAQTDIGMDYAYLDDATYEDWQRYHDLVRRSDNFTKEAEAMQDGSGVSPLSNPVVKELKDIQTEVEDVVLGFETRLRRIRRNNARAFGEGHIRDDADSDDDSVSILPIEDNDKIQSPVIIQVPPVVIGRNKEEVLDALSRIAEADGDTASLLHSTERQEDPESQVRSLVDDGATDRSTASVSPVAHEEL